MALATDDVFLAPKSCEAFLRAYKRRLKFAGSLLHLVYDYLLII